MKKIFCIGSGILNLVVLAFIGIVCFYLSLGSVIKIQLTEVYYDLIEKSGVSVASKEYVEKYGVVDISQS